MSASRIALVTILLGVTGIVGPSPGAGQEEGRQGQAARLAVQNRSADGVRVYVLQAGHMVPVGMVGSAADSTLAITPAFVSSGEEVQIVAERVGGGSWYKSQPVRLRPAGSLTLAIPENLEGASVSVG